MNPASFDPHDYRGDYTWINPTMKKNLITYEEQLHIDEALKGFGMHLNMTREDGMLTLYAMPTYGDGVGKSNREGAMNLMGLAGYDVRTYYTKSFSISKP